MKSALKYTAILALLGLSSTACLGWGLLRPKGTSTSDVPAQRSHEDRTVGTYDAAVLDAMRATTLFQPADLHAVSELATAGQPNPLAQAWRQFSVFHSALLAEATAWENDELLDGRVESLGKSVVLLAAGKATNGSTAAEPREVSESARDVAFLSRRLELWTAVRDARQQIEQAVSALERMDASDRNRTREWIAQACSTHEQLAARFSAPGETEAFNPSRPVAAFLGLYLREVTADDEESRIKQLIALHPKYTPDAPERVQSIRQALSKTQSDRLHQALHKELGLLRIGYLVRNHLPLETFLDASHQIHRLHVEPEVIEALRNTVNSRLLKDLAPLTEPTLDDGIRETVTAREHLIVLGAYEADPDDSLVFKYWYSLLDRRNKRPHRSFVFLGGEYAETDTSKQVIGPPTVPFILGARREYNSLTASLRNALQDERKWYELGKKCKELESQAAKYRGYVLENEAKTNAVFPKIHRQTYAEISFADQAAKADIVIARLEKLKDIWHASPR